MLKDVVMKWVIGGMQKWWNQAVSNPRSTFHGIGGAAVVVGVIEYVGHTLHCDLTQLDFLALVNLWQGGNAGDRTVGDEENERQGGNSM